MEKDIGVINVNNMTNGFYKKYPSKEGQIQKAMERKEKGIADYTTRQEISIAVQSAMRDAFLWCVHHPDWKQDMENDVRFSWIDETAKKLVEFYAIKKMEYAELYENLKCRHREIREKEEEARHIEMDAELQEENGARTVPDVQL